MTKTKAAPGLDEDYQQAGFGGRLEFGKKCALLIVDVVRAYLDPDSPLYAAEFETALQANVRLAAHARARGIPVLFTRVAYTAQGQDGGVFYKKVPALAHYLEGSVLANFADSLQPLATETVVTKQYASAFFGTSLSATLNFLRIDTLLITGFSTSGCVRATVLDAMQHGFIPFVVKDACADRASGPHLANLFDMQAKYAEVVTEQDAIRLMV